MCIECRNLGAVTLFWPKSHEGSIAMEVKGGANVQSGGALAIAELVKNLTFAVVFALLALLLVSAAGALSIPVAFAGAVAGWRFSAWLLSLARTARSN